LLFEFVERVIVEGGGFFLLVRIVSSPTRWTSYSLFACFICCFRFSNTDLSLTLRTCRCLGSLCFCECIPGIAIAGAGFCYSIRSFNVSRFPKL
jgi:hypothetical protein